MASSQTPSRLAHNVLDQIPLRRHDLAIRTGIHRRQNESISQSCILLASSNRQLLSHGNVSILIFFSVLQCNAKGGDATSWSTGRTEPWHREAVHTYNPRHLSLRRADTSLMDIQLRSVVRDAVHFNQRRLNGAFVQDRWKCQTSCDGAVESRARHGTIDDLFRNDHAGGGIALEGYWL